ncbi:MAG: aminotransferase class I/II-fold pyridoxal phosphate-dependent enzyme, partial [Candidatus Aminicenantes bacterium]|nr:aminotransferase class I/II-fold pyridoxal phosphate-dependent enzyme [Candidatus Aminicenantes bacterium]
QSHTTSNACSIAQKAGLEAYEGPQYEVQKMVSEFQRRRNYCLMRLAAVQGLSCFKPQGAFYLFPNVKSFYDKEAGGAKIRNSYGLAYYLLKEARVAVVPGDAFGADDCIRLSYATSMTNLENGLERVVEALGKLKTSRKVKRVALSNAPTRVRKAVPVETVGEAKMRDALVAEMESHLGYEGRYDWNARVRGAVVQLRTNVAHLNDFWVENFPPAGGEAEVKPHGVVYAVDGIAGREPRGFYHEPTQTGVLVNTDLYASLRGLALGLAMDIAARTGGAGTAGAVRGMSADLDGSGLVLVGPPGTKKTELFFGLLADRRFKLHSNDIVFVDIAGGRAAAENVERKLYVPTTAVELDPRLAPLFDRSKCENVVVRKDDCQDLECQRADDCRLDR